MLQRQLLRGRRLRNPHWGKMDGGSTPEATTGASFCITTEKNQTSPLSNLHTSWLLAFQQSHPPQFKGWGSSSPFCFEPHYNQLHEIIYWGAFRTLPEHSRSVGMGWSHWMVLTDVAFRLSSNVILENEYQVCNVQPSLWKLNDLNCTKKHIYFPFEIKLWIIIKSSRVC